GDVRERPARREQRPTGGAGGGVRPAGPTPTDGAGGRPDPPGGGGGDHHAGGELIAELVRSGFLESRHHGSVVVLDAAGEVVAWAGDVTGPVFPRSSSK